ncbi:MAG: hypothetical protein CM15mP93_06390 [Thiotrichaceae bacterium]|nr:MAG: hypothetical protein CM15mP93_06390 [Thiotrichaceae bacterium]
MAIIGGAKVSSKLGVIKSLLDKVDVLILGGGIANTFCHQLVIKLENLYGNLSSLINVMK